MVTLSPVELVVGVAAVVLGIAWMVRPITMRRLQAKYFYFGYDEIKDDDVSERDRWIGRVSGAILTVLGAALLLGVSL